MGFCRRCGDIVNSQRCNKCGGPAVAPALTWGQANPQEYQDKWSRTYVSRDPSISSSPPKKQTTLEGISDSSPTPSLVKRFPKPIGAQITGSASLDNRITHHIASTSHAPRSTSPLKPAVTGPRPESGILPSLNPNDTTLSKVYGSVLQPKESLAMHRCAVCATPFLPDATIYPDPSLPASDEPRFLCRQCFIVSGGSKGQCPNCNKSVTILKADGGFVYAADKYWHKKCFNCEGCSENIGDSPMVDLLGRPSCPQCFDTCLSRESRTPKRTAEIHKRPSMSSERRNPGGFDLSSNTPNKFREASPAIEELEQRFGISRSREGSPAIEELSQRLSSIGKDRQVRYSSPSSPVQTRLARLEGSPSPTRRIERLGGPETFELTDVRSTSTPGSPRRASGSPAPTSEAIEEMKKRFLRHSTTSPTPSSNALLGSSTAFGSPPQPGHSTLSLSDIFSSRRPVSTPQTEPTSPSSSSSTPDFMSDISDTLTQSSFSGADSPPTRVESLVGPSSRYDRSNILSRPHDVIIEETRSQLNTPNQTPQSTIKLRSSTVDVSMKSPPKVTSTITGITVNNVSPSTSCSKCEKPLFGLKEGGKFVTIPGDEASDIPQAFHRDCFRCTSCNGVFNESSSGQAIFVKSNAGPAHLECVPPRKILVHKSPSVGSLGLLPEKPSLKNDYASAKSPSPSPRKSGGNQTSSRYEQPPPAATANTTSLPRFGSRTSCPGCQKFVSQMERGVVPGPQGSRWHADCLVCGGKRPPSGSNSWMLSRNEEKTKTPGCGKKLDSAAKTDADGRIWCRQCLLILGVGGSPEVLPARAPSLLQTKQDTKIPQLAGATTLARQFTGVGNSDTGLLRQLTGGSISPTRSLSPTKQMGAITRPRPKSVIGMRGSKSIDEGRGMFLVRQLTGAKSSNQS